MRWRLTAAAFFLLRMGQAHALPESPAGRRSIRGVTVDEARESDELRAMRRFEDEAAARGATDEPPAENPDRSWLGELSLPDLPVRWDPRVVRFLEFYRNDKHGRAIMASWLKRQGRYRAMIERALAHHRLPKSLLYVVAIESGYDPLDRSLPGASGLWQLMPEGGKIYGLREDHWVDERNDPEKATEATMRYLEDLHARFGSWHLALAAFNAGYGAVIHAVQKYNTNDYWQLCRVEDGLPWETMQYVPKILAVAIVGENRAAFGYGELAPDGELRADRVELTASTTIPTLARAAGVSVEAIAALNPELRRGRTPPLVGDDRWTVKLPPGTAPRFLAAIDKERDKTTTHTVKFGERLEAIARAHGTSVKELRRLNTIRDLAEVRPNLVLVVPVHKGEAGAPTDAKLETDDGDGEPQIVAVPDAGANEDGRKPVYYRVVPGDDVAEVAGYFRVAKDDLARWNYVDLGAKLIPGMVLQVWVDPGFDPGPAALDPRRVRLVTVGTDEFFDLVEARRGRKRLTYVCRGGDTFKKVCARFGLTEGDLERINRMSRGTELEAGRKLVVYVKHTAADPDADAAGDDTAATKPAVAAIPPAAAAPADGLPHLPDGAAAPAGERPDAAPVAVTPAGKLADPDDEAPAAAPTGQQLKNLTLSPPFGPPAPAEPFGPPAPPAPSAPLAAPATDEAPAAAHELPPPPPVAAAPDDPEGSRATP